MKKKKQTRNRRKWTKKDKDFIVKNYGKLTDLKMSKIFKVSPGCIKGQRKKLGIHKGDTPWSQPDINWLFHNYLLYNTPYICQKLNRSAYAIYKMLERLELKKGKKYDFFNLKEELLRQKDTIIKKTVNEVAKELKVTVNSIVGACKDLNIKLTSGVKKSSKSVHWKGYGEISGSQWKSIQSSAKKGRKRPIPFKITIEYSWGLFLKQKRKCALSGTEIGFCATAKNRYIETTASLDRIDSSKGYTKDNVQWVHKKINQMKWSLSDEEFIKWCNIISEYNKR